METRHKNFIANLKKAKAQEKKEQALAKKKKLEAEAKERRRLLRKSNYTLAETVMKKDQEIKNLEWTIKEKEQSVKELTQHKTSLEGLLNHRRITIVEKNEEIHMLKEDITKLKKHDKEIMGQLKTLLGRIKGTVEAATSSVVYGNNPTNYKENVGRLLILGNSTEVNEAPELYYDKKYPSPTMQGLEPWTKKQECCAEEQNLGLVFGYCEDATGVKRND